LDFWPLAAENFVKVMPHDYQRVLEANALLKEVAAKLQQQEGEVKKLSI
jgi:glutamate synthase domain-containing protein 3